MSNWKNKLITWDRIILFLLACGIIAGIILTYYAFNPTNAELITKYCTEWALANKCICGTI